MPLRKLVDRTVQLYLVKIVCHWHRNLSMFVKWGSTISSNFTVTNGVLQGEVLSHTHFLTSIWMD